MRKALLFAINDYQGNDCDLRGCINDQISVEKKLLSLYPDFEIKSFQDSEVTVNNFKSEVEKMISTSQNGDVLLIHYSGHGMQVPDNGFKDELDHYDEALYLYDGALIDDEINDILQKLPEGVKCTILLDSCFSGGATREMVLGDKKVNIKSLFNKEDRKNRRETRRKKREERRIRKRAILTHPDMKWIVISACSENQTSADAFINGKYCGAFSFYLLQCIDKNSTPNFIMLSLKKYLPNKYFSQIPTLECPESMKDIYIFK